MRRFTDRDGREWEVVAGRESWGAIVALFIPVEAGATLRQAPLDAPGYERAEAELDALGETGLQRLLDESRPQSI